MSDKKKDNDFVENLEDWEKDEILKVLQRNNDVKKTEERRLMQLSVRLQLNRMTDDEYATITRVIHQQSGAWMKDGGRTKISDPTSSIRRELLENARHRNEKAREVNNNKDGSSARTNPVLQD